jgi:hypothetical protein
MGASWAYCTGQDDGQTTILRPSIVNRDKSFPIVRTAIPHSTVGVNERVEEIQGAAFRFTHNATEKEEGRR